MSELELLCKGNAFHNSLAANNRSSSNIKHANSDSRYDGCEVVVVAAAAAAVFEEQEGEPSHTLDEMLNNSTNSADSQPVKSAALGDTSFDAYLEQTLSLLDTEYAPPKVTTSTDSNSSSNNAGAVQSYHKIGSAVVTPKKPQLKKRNSKQRQNANKNSSNKNTIKNNSNSVGAAGPGFTIYSDVSESPSKDTTTAATAAASTVLPSDISLSSTNDSTISSNTKQPNTLPAVRPVLTEIPVNIVPSIAAHINTQICRQLEGRLEGKANKMQFASKYSVLLEQHRAKEQREQEQRAQKQSRSSLCTNNEDSQTLIEQHSSESVPVLQTQPVSVHMVDSVEVSLSTVAITTQEPADTTTTQETVEAVTAVSADQTASSTNTTAATETSTETTDSSAVESSVGGHAYLAIDAKLNDPQPKSRLSTLSRVRFVLTTLFVVALGLLSFYAVNTFSNTAPTHNTHSTLSAVDNLAISPPLEYTASGSDEMIASKVTVLLVPQTLTNADSISTAPTAVTAIFETEAEEASKTTTTQTATQATQTVAETATVVSRLVDVTTAAENTLSVEATIPVVLVPKRHSPLHTTLTAFNNKWRRLFAVLRNVIKRVYLVVVKSEQRMFRAVRDEWRKSVVEKQGGAVK